MQAGGRFQSWASILLLAGVVEVIHGLRTQSPSSTWTTYLTGVLMILGGLLLFARPVMVIGGLLALLALIMAADGVTKIVSAFKDKLGQARWWTIFNGIVNLLLALLIWRQGASTGAVVLGIGLGIYIMSTGWTALFAPDDGVEDVDVARATNEHPDERLGLPPHAEFGRLRAAAVEREAAALPIDAFWIIVLILVFFAIHAGRLQADWTWLGLISPLVAVIGDVLSALLVAVLLLPGWLSWRRLTRPIERRAWKRRLSDQTQAKDLGLGEQRRELVARQPLTVGRALAAHARFAANRCLTVAPRWLAHRGRGRGHQSDLGLQLVLQHRELGERLLGEGHRSAD